MFSVWTDRRALAALALTAVAACVHTNPGLPVAEKFRLTDTLAGMIQIDTVKTAKVMGELRLTGKVTFDDDKVVKVFPLAGGVAGEVKAELGDYVEKGKVLAVIRSGEIAGYKQQRIAADADLAIAKKNLEAAEDMHASGLTSDKDLISARKECAKAEAETRRLQEIFGLYDIGEGSEYRIRAPISGFIVEKKITGGTQIRPDNQENLFTISNLDVVWVTADIYESDIAKVKPGYAADVTTLSYEGKVFKGKVDRVSNVIDPETRTLKARIALENPGYLLKPEMFATVAIRYSEDEALPEVPAQSVIFDKSRNFVMIYRGPSDIETREVDLYKTVAGKAYVKGGVKDGERVISRYHLLVYDELNGG